MAPSEQIAHRLNHVLGSLTITHPYHPLKGRIYDVLKVKEINSVRYYSLRVDDDITCVPESWTDRCIAVQSESTGIPFDARHLANLAELLKSLKYFSIEQVNPIDKSDHEA